MAPPAGTLRVGRYFLALGILFVVLYGLIFLPNASQTPKLGLDLVGGAQVVLQASTTNGSAPSPDAMNQARTIIENRVNGRGVNNSEVAIEGGDRITVTIPGKSASDIQDLARTALLEFRPVIAGPFTAAAPTPSTSASASASAGATGSPAPTAGATTGASVGNAPTGAASAGASSAASAQGAAERPLAAASTPASAPGSATAPATGASAGAGGASSGAAAPTDTAVPTAPAASGSNAVPTAAPSVSGASAVTTDQEAAFAQANAQVPGASTLTEDQVKAIIAYSCPQDVSPTDPNQTVVACSEDGQSKYFLDKVLFPGTEIDDASAQAPSGTNLQWTVVLKLKSTGQSIWTNYTATHHNADATGATADTDPSHYVAFTLDGQIITAPNINSTISGDTTITGNFTQTSADQLATSLKYGALPLSFKPLTTQTVSATLGTTQLKSGLLAGGIGLVLVVIYSLLYYRGLGLVTLASLVVSGGIVYASITLLGHFIGFTLTLAGVAGFIVAIGITADSFVVFFERIKDEVHEGRSMRVAVPRAWVRARRTILSADVVSLLAAAVLYFLAAGDVRGFAFTLGLSTIIDIIVVFWFTHPMVSLLSRSRAFGSPRFTGLNAVRGRPAAEAVRETAPSRRPARAGRSRPVAASAAERAAARRGTSVAVLDREDEDGVDEVEDDSVTAVEAQPARAPRRADRPSTRTNRSPVRAEEPAVADDTAADLVPVDPNDGAGSDNATGNAVDDATAGPTDSDESAPAPRRVTSRRTSTSTSGQSAAERAAARRARLRAEKESGS